jgi:predicted GNAT family acetyltransferase
MTRGCVYPQGGIMNQIKTRTVVCENPKSSRFVAYVDGNVAGHIQYELHGSHIWVLSTLMDPRFEEPGVEDVLIGEMLRETQRRRLALLPFCLRTRAYLSHHPRYLALIPPTERNKFRLLGDPIPAR